MKRKYGFTLAEVLITLAIIGVVASMTLPSLNTNIGAARNRAALKKTLATLNNAVKMNEANNGWNFANVGLVSNNDCFNSDISLGRSANAEDTESTCAMFNSALVGETYLGRVASGTPTNQEWKIIDSRGIAGTPLAYLYLINYRLNDGVVFGVTGMFTCPEDGYMNRTLGGCKGYIDTNGAAGPNQVVTCADGSSKFTSDDNFESCDVQRNTNADIFPITFYDSTVELATNAAIAYYNAR